MINIERYVNIISKPILLVGKGPSFDMYENILPCKYHVIALNHVGAKIASDVTSIIDIEVMIQVGHLIEKNTKHLLVPYIPHYKFNAGDKNIVQYASEIPSLKKMHDEGRVVWYNLNTTNIKKEGSVHYLAGINSGDTLFGILACNQIRIVHSLGIDGGVKYSDQFADLKPLTNGQNSFDAQSALIKSAERQLNSKLIPIGNLDVLNIYVGASPNQLIPTKVLEYSIKKNTSNPVNCHPLYNFAREHKVPTDPNNRPRTDFSFKRFLIPELANGKAFYMDSDMQVFGDLANLLSYDFEDHEILSCGGMDQFEHWQHSNYAFLLMDCDNIKWNIDSIVQMLDENKLNYETLMFEFKHAKVNPIFPPEWNSLDLYVTNKTKNIHYTDMSMQPWLNGSKSNQHPFGKIWWNELIDAIQTGFIQKSLFESEVNKRNVYIHNNYVT